MMPNDLLSPDYNVAITLVAPNGDVVDRRITHNILTNVGRKWLRNRLGAIDYTVDPPTPLVETLPMYMGFGVGGAFQTNSGYLNTQLATVDVVELEDPTPLTGTSGSEIWLGEIEPQTGSTYFPSDYKIKYCRRVLESEISYSGAESYSGVVVGTSVPVSEVGLFLSGAVTTSANKSESTPKLIAYDPFAPIVVTPGAMLLVEWEFRC